MTVDEEIGMLGAAALDCSDLKARTMLNLDSEEEGYLLVSCAGGVTTKAKIPIIREEENGYEALITVNGLRGGHSGVEIDKGEGECLPNSGARVVSFDADMWYTATDIVRRS